MKFIDPRNEMIFYGILIWVVGFILVLIYNEISIIALGFNIFGSLFVATGLVFKIPFIMRYMKTPQEEK